MRDLIAIAVAGSIVGGGGGGVISTLSSVAGSLAQGNPAGVMRTLNAYNGGNNGSRSYGGAGDFAYVPYDTVTTGPYSGHFGR